MTKVKFIRALGYVNSNSPFLRFTIENGKSRDSIGDQVWFSKCGKELEVYDWIEADAFNEMLSLFDRDSATAIKGALRSAGLNIDSLIGGGQ